MVVGYLLRTYHDNRWRGRDDQVDKEMIVYFRRTSTISAIVVIVSLTWPNMLLGQSQSSNPGSPGLSFGDTYCMDLRALGQAYKNTGKYKESFDTLKKFIEVCPTFEGSFRTFSSIDGALGSWKTGSPNRFAEHRPWLLQVLYLNTIDTNYYCADIHSLISTFREESRRDYNGMLGMIKYVIEAGKCSEEWTNLFVN